jgi:hypothetical protein
MSWSLLYFSCVSGNLSWLSAFVHHIFVFISVPLWLLVVHTNTM